MSYSSRSLFEPTTDDAAAQIIARIPAGPTQQSQPSILGGGISAGLREARGLGGEAVSALGKLTGLQGLEQWGAAAAQSNFAKAQQVGRPDLEIAPWREGGASTLPWLAYNVAKALPTTAAAIGAGMLVPEAAVPAAAARIGAAVPGWLGGGGALTGAAAQAAGTTWARGMIGGAAVTYPSAVGGVYQASEDARKAAGTTTTVADAATALMAGVPLSILGAMSPTQLRGLAQPLEAGGSLASRQGLSHILSTGAAAGLAAIPQAGVQTAAEMAQRTDLPVAERMGHVVDAAISGGLIGGVLGAGAGAVSGVRTVRRRAPNDISTSELGAVVDQSLQQPELPGMPEAPAPAGQSEMFPAANMGQAPTPQEQLAGIEARMRAGGATQADALLRQELLTRARAVPEGQPDLFQPRVAGELPEGQGDLPGVVRAQGELPLGQQPIAELSASRPAVEVPPEVAPVQRELFAPDDLSYFGRQNAADLARITTTLEDRIASGEGTVQDEADLRQARIAAERKAAEPVLEDRGPELFAPDALAQPLVDRSQTLVARDRAQARAEQARSTQAFEEANPDIASTRQMLRDLVGKQVQATRTMMARDTPDLVNVVLDAYNSKTSPEWSKTAAEKLGLIDRDGNARDLAGDLVSAEQRAAAAERQGDQVALADVTREVADLRGKLAAVEEAQRRREGPTPDVELPPAQAELLPSVEPPAPIIPPAAEARLTTLGIAASGAQLKLSAVDQILAQADTPDGVRTQAADAQAALRAAIDAVPSDLTKATDRERQQAQKAVVDAAARVDAVVADQNAREGKIVFRAAEDTAPAMSANAFAKVFDKLVQKIAPEQADRIQLVSTAAELPPHVLGAAEAQGIAPGAVRGVLSDGMVYIVRDNVRSPADLQETLMHEVLGHGGARALLGSERGDTMTRLFDLTGGVDNVKKIARRFGVEKALNEYIPDRPLNADDKAMVFDELLAQAAGAATGKVQTALLTWAGQIKRATVSFLERAGMTALAARMDTMGAVDVAVMLKNMRAAVAQGRALDGSDTAFRVAAPAQAAEAVKNFAATADKVKDALDLASRQIDAKVWMGNVSRQLAPLWDMVRQYNKYFQQPGADPNTPTALNRVFDAKTERSVATRQFAKLSLDAVEKIQTLEITKPKAAEAIVDLMKASGAQIDPTRPPAEHTWLHKLPNWPQLEKLVSDQNKIYHNLVRMGEAQAYHEARALNEMQFHASLALNLRDWVLRDPVTRAALPSFEANPMDAFRLDTAAHEQIGAARSYWQDANTRLVGEARQYVTDRYTAAQGLPEGARAKEHARITPLEHMVRNTEQSMERAKNAPYFHLGRDGNHYVAFDMGGAADKDGKVTQASPEARAAVIAAFEKAGIGDIEMTWANDRPDAYIRVRTASEASAIRDALETLQPAGHVQRDSVVVGERSEPKISNKLMSEVLRQYTAHLDEANLTASRDMPADERRAMVEQKQRALSEMQDFLLDILPDSAVNKMWVPRAGVSGYSSDMVRSFARRAQIGGNAIANVASTMKQADAMRELRGYVHAAQGQAGGTTPVADIAAMHGMVSELERREAVSAPRLNNSIPDTIRAINHGWFSMLSPAYAMVQLSSIPQLLMPELGRSHGHVKAAQAIGSATGAAMRVMTSALKEGWGKSGAHAADGAITQAVLDKAGISKADANIIMRMVNRGDVEVGSQSHELGRVADSEIGGKVTNFTRYATAMSYYAEAFARLVTVLAADKLHGNKPLKEEYIAKVLRESQFTFSEYNNPKFLSRNGGVAGPLTPIMASFLSWQTQMTSKMFREIGTAFLGQAETPAQRNEARRFLAGHAAAMVVLAGTLGLPFASVAARAIDKTVDMFSEDGEAPFDVKASWRNFLADTLGKDVGEVLARGASRAVGADLSGRLGEQDLLPFSRFLTDRRKARDIAEDLVLRTAGSPVSAAVNIFDGLNDLAGKGDVITGMGKILPTALRNQFNAYQMSQRGYVDRQGNRLPMEPGATAILAQALGFTPAQRAEYSEAQQAQSLRRSDLQTMGSTLRRHALTALDTGDEAGLRDTLARAQAFGQQNPAYDVIHTLAPTFARRMQDRAVSAATNTPLGINRKDAGAAGLTRYANWGIR